MFPFKSKIPVVQNVIFDKEGDTITIHLNLGAYKFKNPSHFYRCISQGNWRFLRQSNRSFFCHFSDGMYRSAVDNEKVTLIFFLRVKNTIEKYRITKELSIRMKKLMNSPIQILDIREMSETDRKLLKTKNGFKFYNWILG